jgi:hypothetical protein
MQYCHFFSLPGDFLCIHLVPKLPKPAYIHKIYFSLLQSEAKIKEDLEDNVKGNKEAINNLYQHFTERLDEIKGVNSSQSGKTLFNSHFEELKKTMCNTHFAQWS